MAKRLSEIRAAREIKIVVAGGTAGKFCRYGQLGDGPARQPDGDVSDQLKL